MDRIGRGEKPVKNIRSKNRNRNALIAGALFLGIGAYIFSEKEDKSFPQRSFKAKKASIIGSEKVVKEHIKSNRSQGMRLQAIKSVGFVPVTDAQGTNWDFSIKIGISDNKCRLGDFDIIQRELHLNKNQNLYLTVENLNSGKILSQTKLNLDDIPNSDYEKGFSLESRNDPTYMGVFLCTKSSPKQPCAKQLAKKIDDIDSLQRKATLGDKRYNRKGKMFFFQYLTAIDGKLQIFKMNNLLNSHFKRMESVYRKLDPKQTYRKPMKMAKTFSQRIGSLKPSVRFGKIHVYLPRKSPSCPIAKFAP